MSARAEIRFYQSGMGLDNEGRRLMNMEIHARQALAYYDSVFIVTPKIFITQWFGRIKGSGIKVVTPYVLAGIELPALLVVDELHPEALKSLNKRALAEKALIEIYDLRKK